MNVGSEANSERDRGHKLTQYDREKLQLKIEEMKMEMNKHYNKIETEEDNYVEEIVENEE